MTATASPSHKGKTSAGLRLPNSWVDALRKRASARGTAISTEIRIALAEYFDREGITVD